MDAVWSWRLLSMLLAWLVLTDWTEQCPSFEIGREKLILDADSSFQVNVTTCSSNKTFAAVTLFNEKSAFCIWMLQDKCISLDESKCWCRNRNSTIALIIQPNIISSTPEVWTFKGGLDNEHSSKEQEVTIIVRRKPQFTLSDAIFTTNSSDLLLQFPFHMVDKNVTDCRLTHYNTPEIACELNATERFETEAENKTTSINCSSLMEVEGMAPNLTLTVQLLNVTLDMNGLWKLDLWGSDGMGSVNFSIVSKVTRQQSCTSTHDTGMVVLVTAVVVPVVSVLVVVIAFIIYRKRCWTGSANRNRSRTQTPAQERPAPMELWDLPGVSRTRHHGPVSIMYGYSDVADKVEKPRSGTAVGIVLPEGEEPYYFEIEPDFSQSPPRSTVRAMQH